MRALLGTKFGFDGTFKAVSSLSGAERDALTAHMKAKSSSFEATLLTGTGAHGLVLFALVAPSEAHRYLQAGIRGAWHAAPSDDAEPELPLERMLREHVAVGGPVPQTPLMFSTDHATKDCNLWEPLAHDVVAATQERGGSVWVPRGAGHTAALLMQPCPPPSSAVSGY